MLTATEAVTGARPSVSTYDDADRAHFECADLKPYLGSLVENKYRIPEFVWQGTRACQQAYLSALFSADGSVQGTKEKGTSIRLASSKLSLLKEVQVLLLNFGVASRVYEERRPAGHRDLPDGSGGYKSYFCEADHELVVSKSNVIQFAEAIGFMHQGKSDRLAQEMKGRARGFYRESFTATVEALVPDGVEDVYDVSVPGTNSFIANGMVVHNCGEIGLNPWESCNLGHVNMEYFAPNPSGHTPVTTMKEAFRLMARWLVRATFGDIPQPRQRKVVDKNRRIGVGFFGYHAWLALHGTRYSEGHKTPWVINTLKEMKQTVIDSATSYAQKLGIPVPVKFTTLAPTGTIATLPGTTGSGQSMMAPWFKRLVRYSDMDPDLISLRDSGIEVFPDDDAKNTSIAVFWCEDPLVAKVRAVGFDPAEVLESQYEVTMETNLATQAMFQEHYVDNAVSFTINLRPEDMPPEEEMERLLMTYLPRLKGTTVFPEKSRKNTPIQPVTKAQFDAHTGPKQVTAIEIECVGGCPVK